jgi:hypothetical protein
VLISCNAFEKKIIMNQVLCEMIDIVSVIKLTNATLIQYVTLL